MRIAECSKTPTPCDKHKANVIKCHDVYNEGRTFKCECKPQFTGVHCTEAGINGYTAVFSCITAASVPLPAAF